MPELRNRLIRLAYQDSEARKHLLPLLEREATEKQAMDEDDLMRMQQELLSLEEEHDGLMRVMDRL